MGICRQWAQFIDLIGNINVALSIKKSIWSKIKVLGNVRISRWSDKNAKNIRIKWEWYTTTSNLKDFAFSKSWRLACDLINYLWFVNRYSQSNDHK